MYVRPNGMVKLGSFLGSWFAYSIVVSLVVGYLARATVRAGRRVPARLPGRRRRGLVRLRLVDPRRLDLDGQALVEHARLHDRRLDLRRADRRVVRVVVAEGRGRVGG